MSVKSLVDSAIADGDIVIFSKSYCPYCQKAKTLFNENYPSVKPTVFELDERDDGADIQAYLAQKTGQSTVPNIFVHQKHVGGSSDVADLQSKGKLAALVKA